MAIEKLEKKDNIVIWMYNENSIKITKKKIIDYLYNKEEKLILLIFEDEDIYPVLEGINEDGTLRFYFKSTDEIGVSRFTSHPYIDIPVIGWQKEDDLYTDYYFSVNPINGELTRHFRAY